MIVEPWLSELVSLVPFFSWILIRCDLEKLKRLKKFINPSKLVFRTLFLICFALKTCERHDAGASHYAKISGNFRSKCKWNGLAQVEIFRSKWSASRGGHLGLVGPVGPSENCRSIFRNSRFQFCSSSSLHTVVRMVDGSDVGVYECSACKLQTQDLNFLLMHSCTQGLGTVVHLDLFFFWVYQFLKTNQFKVDRLQIIVVAKKYISTCRNCSLAGCLKCVQFHNWFRLH